MGYTKLVKTAISLPDQLFADAEAAARILKISRSQLYAQALEMFLSTQEQDPVTCRLDQLASQFPAAPGSEAGRRLIDRGLWQW